MPHDEHPDDVSDPLLIIKELRGVVRRQRLLLLASFATNVLMFVRLYKSC